MDPVDVGLGQVQVYPNCIQAPVPQNSLQCIDVASITQEHDRESMPEPMRIAFIEVGSPPHSSKMSCQMCTLDLPAVIR